VEEWQQAIKSCWNNECSLTEIRIKELVVANDVVHNFEDREQAQEMNGITLAPQISVLFDRGLISFEDDGRLLVSPRLSEEDFRRLSLPGELRRPPTVHEMALLRQHRERVFFRT
jgi:predicted restriction endonuclease